MSNVQSKMYSQLDYSKERARLQKWDFYMPGARFLHTTTWTTDQEDGMKTLSEANGIASIQCIGIGTVSQDDLFVSPLGDCKLIGEPLKPSTPIVDSRIRFTLVQPKEKNHSVFINDYKKMITATRALIDAMPIKHEEKTTEPFLTSTADGSCKFSFEFTIFQDKVSLSVADSQQTYPPHIRPYMFNTESHLTPTTLSNFKNCRRFYPFLEELNDRYHARTLRVWDSSKEGIEPDDIANYMEDNLVEVAFDLKFDSEKGLIGEVAWVSILN